MQKRVIAIGDVHGCADALRSILGTIDPRPEDTIVMLGDIVDRGPDSCGAIDELLELRERCKVVAILGNHEEMMLKFVEQRPQPDDWLQCGGAETLASYGSKNHRKAIPSHHLDYVRTWVDCFETASHFFVHGNYNPDQQLPEQPFHLYRWISLRQSVPAAHCSGKTAIVGHTSQKDGEILEIGYLRCIDTYCHGGGWLTALDTVSGKIWQVDRDGRMRDD